MASAKQDFIPLRRSRTGEAGARTSSQSATATDFSGSSPRSVRPAFQDAAARSTDSAAQNASAAWLYRGPPLADLITHLASDEIYSALGDSYETMRTSFQYRRDGVAGRLAEHEEAITTASTERRMRVRIPVVGDDHTPAFELI